MTAYRVPESIRKQVRLRRIEDVQGLEDSHVILFLRQPQRTADGYINLQIPLSQSTALMPQTTQRRINASSQKSHSSHNL
jgi:hypothetical protein